MISTLLRVQNSCYRFPWRQRRKILVILWWHLWLGLPFESYCWQCQRARHRSLSSSFIKHILFYQSKIGRVFELQNKNIAHFESFHDVMQFRRVSAELRLDSELVGWHRDETSVLATVNSERLVATSHEQNVEVVPVQTANPCIWTFTFQNHWNIQISWKLITQKFSDPELS